jgi:phosphoglycolate phosphatase-like HAD superfamily hydrolase
MVGDTPVDVYAGQRAGAQTIGVLCGLGSRASLQNAGADLLLDTTADLKSVLQAA